MIVMSLSITIIPDNCRFLDAVVKKMKECVGDSGQYDGVTMLCTEKIIKKYHQTMMFLTIIVLYIGRISDGQHSQGEHHLCEVLR